MSGTVVQASASIPAGGTSYPVTVKGVWVTIHDDLEATAETSTVLNRPLSNTGTNAHPAKVSDGGGKWMVRAKYAKASSPTSPKMCIYAIYGEPGSDGNFADDGTVPVIRLDNSDSGAAGVEITIDPTNDICDGTYRYSDPITFTPSDALGAWYILALTHTAASSVAGAVTLQLMTLN